QVEIDTELRAAQDIRLTHTLRYQGEIIAATAENIPAAPGVTACSQQSLVVEHPQLWNTDEPNLYQLVTELHPAGAQSDAEAAVIETVTHNVGFRTVVLDPQQGFLLNGRKMKLNGVCEHHDLGALGAAFNL